MAGMIFFLCTSCRKTESWSDDRAESTIPFEDLPDLKCFRLSEGTGLVLTHSSINSGIILYSGFTFATSEERGRKICTFSFKGTYDSKELPMPKVFLFSGGAGSFYMILPTFYVSDPDVIYYKDRKGLHEIQIGGPIDPKLLPQPPDRR